MWPGLVNSILLPTSSLVSGELSRLLIILMISSFAPQWSFNWLSRLNLSVLWRLLLMSAIIFFSELASCIGSVNCSFLSVIVLYAVSVEFEWPLFVLQWLVPVRLRVSCMLSVFVVLLFSDWLKNRPMRSLTVASCAMALMTNSSS